MQIGKAHLTAALMTALLGVASAVAAPGDYRLAEAAKQRDAIRVRALLQQRVDVNTPMPDGATALHWPAQWDDLDLADLLIVAHARIDTADVYGVTPLSLACTNGSV